jgi:hypothetical protein
VIEALFLHEELAEDWLVWRPSIEAKPTNDVEVVGEKALKSVRVERHIGINPEDMSQVFNF